MNCYKTSDKQKILLYEIASLMKEEGLSDQFIAYAVELGLYYEGVYDLFELWGAENDQKERDQIITDIQEEINEYKEQVKRPTKKTTPTSC